MKPMTKTPDWNKDPFEVICAPVSATWGNRRHDGAGYHTTPEALKNRVADIRRAEKQRRERK